MRKVLAILLSVVFLFSFVGCVETEDNPSPRPQDGPFKPTKAITFVVPFEAGGNSDIPARVFAKYMTKYSDVEIKISNIVGAGGRTGADEVSKASPDGYTVLMQPVGYPMQYSLGVAKFTYKDFEPIGLWLDSSLAIVVNAKSEFKTLDDLIVAAKAKPNTIKMGSYTGTLPLFAIIDLEQRFDVSFKKVDLQQKAPELLSNRIDAYIDGFGSVKQYIDSDSFRCLGIISDVDVDGYEKLSTYKELGIADYEYLKQSFGMWAPKGTSKSAVDYINNLIEKASSDPECIAELKGIGFLPTYMSVEDYTEFLEKTYSAFEEVAKLIVG